LQGVLLLLSWAHVCFFSASHLKPSWPLMQLRL
jgi:hypothetical protein